jgi:hypothetical protein
VVGLPELGITRGWFRGVGGVSAAGVMTADPGLPELLELIELELIELGDELGDKLFS